MSHILPWAVGLVLLAGCAPAPPCDCEVAAFCCEGRCLPFGSRCGEGADGGDLDARASDVDALPGPDVPAPDDASIDPCVGHLLVCADLRTTRNCRTGATERCPRDGTCLLRHAADGTPTGEAACFDPGTAPCAVEGAVCEGAVVVRCSAGIERRIDCTELAADAVCQALDEGRVGCRAPGAEPCDVLRDVARCRGELTEECAATVDGGRWVERPCPDAGRCAPLEGAAAICVPAEAVPSEHGPTEGTWLRCDGDRVRIERHGYEWTIGCAPAERCVANEWTARAHAEGVLPLGPVACVPIDAIPYDGEASTTQRGLRCRPGDELTVERFGLTWPIRCGVDGLACVESGRPGGGASCVTPGTTGCDPAVFVARCGADGTSVERCSASGYRALGRCITAGHEQPCDPATDECARVPPARCADLVPQCGPEGWRAICDEALAIPLFERCPGCRDGTGGATCTP